ncbi:MAG TPA: DUF4214 domain-containing protein, partial [Iamia sp.]|nr:DUF4214 domain-containing protein [Iamia sp.]
MYTMGDHDRPGARPRIHLRRRGACAALLALTLGVGLVGATGSPAGAATSSASTGRISVTSAGAELPGNVGSAITAVDATGRYVAFSGAALYGPADTNDEADVYLRDRTAGTTTRVSVTDDEDQISGLSVMCGASSDLRFVAFWSNGENMAGGTGQIFLRDRSLGTTRLVSQSTGGIPSVTANGGSGMFLEEVCDVSLDGRYVAFTSEGSNLVSGDTNGFADVFRRDMTAATTIRVSVKNAGAQVTGGGSYDPSMPDDGDPIVFTSSAPTVTMGDGNGKPDVFQRDQLTSSTTVVSLKSDATYPNGASYDVSIAGDGSVVAFTTTATDLLPPGQVDGNGTVSDVVGRATNAGQEELLSVGSTEAQANGYSRHATVSADGRYVAFTSAADNLWLVDANGQDDAYVRDLDLELTSLASRRSTGFLAGTGPSSGRPVISADGSVTAFASNATDLARGDTNQARDVYVRDAAVDHTPFDSFDALVAQQFADFAGRAPTATEAAEWKARLVNGEVSPDEVIADLAHSTAWSSRRAPVTRLYWAFFLRAPDAAGLDYWVAQNKAGKGLHTIAGQFALSGEFKTTYGPLSNQAFVTLVYQNVLERDPAPNEVAYWSQQLATGAKTRGSVMVGFSESAEGR